MKISRRGLLIVGSTVFVSGCVENAPSNRTTNDSTDTANKFSIDDILVQNERTDSVEVTVSVARSAEPVFEEAFALAPDETKTFEDVMANGYTYEVTISADGLTNTATFDEHHDNAGVRFVVTSEKIESIPIVH